MNTTALIDTAPQRRTRQRCQQRRVVIVKSSSRNWRGGDMATLKRRGDGVIFLDNTMVTATRYPAFGVAILRFLSITWTIRLADYDALVPQQTPEGAQSA
jgi:hypothetical protein